MKFDQLLLLFYVISPFLAAVLPWPRGIRNSVLTPGVGASILRGLALCLLGGTVISSAGRIGLSGTLVNGYPLDIVLSFDAYRFGFLLTAELCFLLAHWITAPNLAHSTLIRLLISLAQGFCSLFIMSDNAVTTGALQMLAGVVFFYLVRFSLEGKAEELGVSISRRIYFLSFLLGLIMIGWGILEFSEKELLFSRGQHSSLGITIWLSLLILSVPILPWSRWFEESVVNLPEGVTLALVTFLSAVTLKFSSLFSLVYPDLHWKQKLVVYVLGILGCVFSLSGLFSARSRRHILGSLPGFFFSLILVSVGVSKSELVISAYFCCLFVPIFTGLVLYASVARPFSAIQMSFTGLLFAVIIGLPGTPVFLIFSAIGARSLDMGTSYMLLFGLLWFFYLSANIYICRRFFMDKDPPETGVVSLLENSPVSLATYGIFMMLFAILITQAAWRIL